MRKLLDHLRALIRPLLRCTDAVLNQNPRLSGYWQNVKWRIKYHLDHPRYTPRLDSLLRQPHRRILAESVIDLGVGPAGVLEVGCGKGQNLIILAEVLPGSTLQGIDISRAVVDLARKELKARSISTVTIGEGGTDSLASVADETFDVVLCDAVLMYLPPAKIFEALRQMLRVARRGVIVGTWHEDIPTSETIPSHYDEGAWIHDYRRVLKDLGGITVDIRSYPEGAWQDLRWKRYGNIVSLVKHGPEQS